ncbi:MAG TPA: ATP-binding protein [Candidatus Limnocylindria bacterium]|nr:ATP-binding protein [Candidatus Limnocylindria bacterium]
MIRSLDLDHRLRNAVSSARDLIPADAAAVFLPNDDGDALVVRAHDGLSESYAAQQSLPMDEVRAQFRAAGEHVVLDIPAGSVGDHELIKAEGLAKLLSLPLFFEKKLIGALVIYSKDLKRTFEPDDIEVAHLLAATTAIGISNSRLYAEAVAQQDLHRHLLDALGDGVLIGWPNGRFETNPRAREILGVGVFETLAELRAAVDVRDLITGEPVPTGGYPLDRALRGEKSKGEFFVVRPDTGERRDLEVTAAPVRGPKGEVVAGVMTLHDITDLLASEREREQFLSIVSHELRTPLTPLKALAQLVRSRMRRAKAQGTELDLESLDRNLAAIERQVDRMNGLVNDLLSVSRAEKGSLSMERVPYDLAVVLREVVQRYIDATLEEGRHTFTVEAPASVPAHGDQARIEQLLMNLVGNAVKYSPTGGPVRVALSAHDRSAEIAISDEGIGIPADDIGRLGHPFVRGAGRAATFAGMGVGLYVARIVAEAHAGSLALESDGDRKGTTVRVKLPL